MPIADFIILFLTGVSALLGLSRGFVKEFLSLAKWVSSLYLAFLSYEKTKTILSSFLKESEVLDLLAASISFCLLYTSPSPRDRG